MSIPDIQLVRERGKEYTQSQQNKAVQRFVEYQQIKDQAITHFYTILESSINDQLLKGRKVSKRIEFRAVMDYIEHALKFRCTSCEYLEILKCITDKVEKAYYDAGYITKQISYVHTHGSHFLDRYTVEISF